MIDPKTIQRFIDRKILKEDTLLEIKDEMMSKILDRKASILEILEKPESERTTSENSKLDANREYVRYGTKRLHDLVQMQKLSQRMINPTNEGLLKIIDFKNSFIGKKETVSNDN